jgi:hypothetical protein
VYESSLSYLTKKNVKVIILSRRYGLVGVLKSIIGDHMEKEGTLVAAPA